MLSQEERTDLRKRVLAGIPLTLDEAAAVVASLRTNQSMAVVAGEAKAETNSKGKKASKGLSDEALDKDLADLGL